MRNLAGNKDSTAICEQELIEAGIPVCQLEEPYGEVGSNVGGFFLTGNAKFTFHRAWYYWVVKGPLPIKLAERLYADPIGRETVRVCGHCGCPPPSYGVEWRKDGIEIVLDRTGQEERDLKAMYKRHKWIKKDRTYIFVRKMPRDAQGFVDSYHVDSAEGLKLIADAIKEVCAANDSADRAKREAEKRIKTIRRTHSGAWTVYGRRFSTLDLAREGKSHEGTRRLRRSLATQS